MSAFVLPWTNCRFPFATFSVPFAFCLTPVRPISWTALTGAGVSCAFPMEVSIPAKSKATETRTAVRLGAIHSPSVEFICFNERAPT